MSEVPSDRDVRAGRVTPPGPGSLPPGGPSFGAATLHDEWQGRWRWGWVYAGVWLVFLVPTFVDGVRRPDRVRGWAGALLLVVFSVFYLRTWSTARSLRIQDALAAWRRRYPVLAVAVAILVVDALLLGSSALALTPFILVLVMFLLPRPGRLIGTALVIAGTVAATELIPGWSQGVGVVFGLVLTAFVMWGMIQMIERNHELAKAHQRLAELAVAEERARFARDLHDLLGHSLTLLAIKAELAGRLVHLDADRAEQEIADVERLARDALADVRAAVGGYRKATLTAELVSARAVLDAAGIEGELPTAVDEVAGERRELLGWAVREGVTNVVRHSGARRCRILVDADGVEVLDDGRGPGVAPPSGADDRPLGSGLRGLRERAAAAGAVVVVGTAPEGGFRLRVGW